MARWLRKSTASTFRIGPFLDDIDFTTAEIGLTIVQADIQISKDGGAFAQTSNASPTTTHDTDGWYQCPFTTLDTDTLGPLTVQVSVAGALPVWEHFQVVVASVYDAYFAGLLLRTDVRQMEGDSSSLADLKDFADSGYNPVTKKVQGVVLVDTTTDVTNEVSADAVKISGDATAADNLELQYDTTGITGDTFPATQSQLDNIALTGAAVSTPAKDAPNGFAITWGENEANDEDSTHAVDGTTHDIEAQNDTGTEKIDVYYEFAIGGDGVSVGVQAHHQLDKGGGVGKDITVQAYNWGTTSWDQIGSLDSGTSLSTDSFTLFTSHVGTGANLGLVRIRYVTGSVAFTATTKLLVDQIFVEYAIVSRTVGYAGGAIWVDTNASNTNTESFVDGTADNPVSTWAAALTLSGQLNIVRFNMANGSSITLTGNSDGYDLFGTNWSLALGGQSIASAYIRGAIVTGTGTASTETDFSHCRIGAVTLGLAHFIACGLVGPITVGLAGTYVFQSCHSEVAGTGVPALDFAAIVNSAMNFRDYSGGIEIKNMGGAGTDTMSLEGDGQLVINANCSGGTVAIRGNFTVTDGASGAVTLSDDARYDVAQVNAEVDAALADIKLDHLVALADGDDPVDNSIIAKMVSSAGTANWSDFVNTTDSLQAIRDRGDSAWTTGAAGSDFLKYPGPRGPGVYLDDGAANTNTVVGVDGIESNPVSTIAAATTIAGSLGIQRIYLINDSVITLAQTYEGWEFFGIGLGNQITLGGQDVDNSSFFFMMLTGTQGGTGMLYCQECSMTGLASLECIAYLCYLTGTNTVRASSLIVFQHCESAVPGNNTPELTFSGGASAVNFRHYSGGLQLNSMGTGDTMSYETDGQIIIDASCTDGLLTVRGCCDITDNASGAVTITQSAAINQANIKAEVDAAIVDARLDHLLLNSVAGADVADDSVIAKLASKSATADWDSFNNQTESLEALRDFFVSSGVKVYGQTTSYDSTKLLERMIERVRQMVDEPASNSKYTDLQIERYLRAGWETVLVDINSNSDAPVVVRHNITMGSATQVYVLPPTVGEILELAEIDSDTDLVLREIVPRSRWNPAGPGYTIEGNTLRISPKWAESIVIRVTYIPTGSVDIHWGTTTTFTSSTITLDSSPSFGTLDKRMNAYAGCILRTLGSIDLERVITAYDAETNIATVAPDFDPALAGTVTYEVVPLLWNLMEMVVCLSVGTTILSMEGDEKREMSLKRRYQETMRAMKLRLNNMENRVGGRFEHDTRDNRNLGRSWGWGIGLR